jgi:hypothetical protein
MAELLGKFGEAPGFIEHRVDAATASSPRTPVMISAQQVLFATAAAMRLRPSKTCLRWTAATREIGANLRSTIMASRAGARPRRRHCSSRRLFFEDSRMAREMLRL